MFLFPCRLVSVAFRCWLRRIIKRQSVVSRGCSHACLTLPRTLVSGPALISLPWKRSDTSWEKSWKRRVFVEGNECVWRVCRCQPSSNHSVCCCCWRSSRCAAHRQRRPPLRSFLTRKFQMCCSFLSTARGMWGMPEQRQTNLNLECTLKALNCSISLTTGRVFPEAKPTGNFMERWQKKHWDTFRSLGCIQVIPKRLKIQ